MRFIVIATVAVVFLILVMLLRAVVAPLYLVGTVVLSYLSALGIAVIALQFVGHESMAASMPGMAFIVLVAVGADYNMLLISRIRDESPQGIRSGIVRTVRSTGASSPLRELFSLHRCPRCCSAASPPWCKPAL